MKLLYLRTRYAFNLKAGGSVGHTSGVINAFKKFLNINVVSNDILVGVEDNIDIEKPIKIRFLPSEINELLYNFKIIKYIKQNKYNIIYQRYSGFSFSGAYLSNKYDIPFILEFNSSEIWKIKNWKPTGNLVKIILHYIYNNIIKLPIVSYIENYNLKNSTLIVVVSQVLKDSLVTRGIKKEKILVNPNGIDKDKYNPTIEDKGLQQKYKLENKVILGFIGTFGQWHGAENIVEAYGKLLKSYPEYALKSKLIMIGDGIKMSIIKSIIKKYKIEDNVILTGLIEQSKGPRYLSICNILINATTPNPDGSKFFGSPTKLFEYMAMGKAIISSDMAQMKDILIHNEIAYMVKPGSVADLTISMKVLLDNKNLCYKLGLNARNEVVSKYTWEKHIENIINKLKENNI
jgi:glycosyltransferase involved in cell wall biosynthesis